MVTHSIVVFNFGFSVMVLQAWQRRCRWQAQARLYGVIILMACVWGGQRGSALSVKAGSAFAGVLARHRVAVDDMRHYWEASAATIMEVITETGSSVRALSLASNVQSHTLWSHLRGERVLSDTSLNRLLPTMRQAVADTDLHDNQRWYYYDLLDELPLAVRVERATVKLQKMAAEGKLADDNSYVSYLNNVVRVRRAGLAEVVPYLPTKTVPKDNGSRIEGILQQYGVSVAELDNYDATSVAVVQRIIATIGVGSRHVAFKQAGVNLHRFVHGISIIEDATVAKLRVVVEQLVEERGLVQRYGEVVIKQELENVFAELDQVLRVERAARELRSLPQPLDIVWEKRVNRVLAERKNTATPLRHRTSWEKIIAYDKSSRAILVEIMDTMYDGGWLTPFGDSKRLLHALNGFMRGDFLISDNNIRNLGNALKQTLKEEPVPTSTTKRATLERLKVLLPELSKAVRVERSLRDHEDHLATLTPTRQQHVQHALVVRDAHRWLSSFYITWNDVSAFNISSVTVIRSLLDVLQLSASQLSKRADLAQGMVSAHLRGNTHLSTQSAVKLSRVLCFDLAVAALPTARVAELRQQALHLHKLIRIEKAATEILGKQVLTDNLNDEQKGMLRTVLAIKQEALAAPR